MVGRLNAKEIKATITLRGKESDVKKEYFVWILEDGNKYSPLTPQRMIVSGKMRVGDELEDVEITDGGFSALEFHK